MCLCDSDVRPMTKEQMMEHLAEAWNRRAPVTAMASARIIKRYGPVFARLAKTKVVRD